MHLKRLAFITDYYPYMGGVSSRVAEQLRVLSARYEVHLIFMYRKSGSVDVSGFAKEHRIDSGAGQRGDSSEVSRNPLSLLGRPALVLDASRNFWTYGSPLYYSPYVSDKTRAQVAKVLAQERIDVIWANGVIGALMAGRAGAKLRILDMCDSRALLYSTLRRIERSPLKKALLAIDGMIARRFERAAPKRFDMVLYICRRDGLFSGLREQDFAVLPNVRRDAEFSKLPKKTDIVMLGRWDYLPNLDSLNFAVREILPKLKRAVRVEVVGTLKDRDRAALEWASRGASNSKLAIAGVVDDVFARLSASRMMLAPLRAGAGVQNKILDAAEVGIPVVTTPFSKSAVDPEGKCEGIIACRDAAEAASAADRILSDQKEAERLGKACRSFYESYNAESKRLHDALMEKIDARVGS